MERTVDKWRELGLHTPFEIWLDSLSRSEMAHRNGGTTAGILNL